MKRPKSRFNSSRFTTSTPLQIKRKHCTKNPPLLLMKRTANLNPMATALLRVEISFLVTLTAVIAMHVVRFYTFRRAEATSTSFRAEGFIHHPQGCDPISPLQADHTSTTTRLVPFTALDWPSTTSPPISSPPSRGVTYLGPGALLDDDSAASCFAFSGSSGGVVLVSTSKEYTITQFTLDNTVIDTMVEPIYYPKEGALWGLFEGPLPEGLKNTTTSFVAEHAAYIVIGVFCFSSERGPVQSFSIDDSITSLPTIKFSVFYLEISSNWGGSHTCLGRIRLHGSP